MSSNAPYDQDSAHQRGLRISKPHAEELVNLYSVHAQSESFRSEDLSRVNKAHVVMLAEQELLSRKEAGQILKILKKLDSAGVDRIIHLDPRIGDLSTHVEAYVIRETGEEVGGKIHTGRSRNDLYPTLTKMLLRRWVLDLYEALLTLENSLLALAERHNTTLCPGYTHHSQSAQPITLGHFFLGNADVFARDIARLESFWPRLNTCPMGAAAIATTGFPLNRARMAQLLGFDRIHEHSYDAVSAKDFLLEYLFILASISSDIGRIAESLLLWNTEPFAMIVLADEYTSFSSIMPQKKNPVSIESLRAFNVLVYGKLLNAFGILKAEPWSNGRETVILDDDSVDTGRQVRDMVLLLNGVLNSLEVRKDRMEELSDQGFSTATELADTLVRRYRFSFRTAHEVVGLVVKKAAQARLLPKAITAKMVEESIQEHLGRAVSIDPEEVRKALDPRENVERRCLPGGPAFEQVLRMLTNRKEGMEERRTFLSHRRHLIAESQQMLDEKVKEFIGEETL